MSRDVIVQFKCFRSFVVVSFLGNALAFLAAFVFHNPFVAFVTAVLTLGWLSWCIRCIHCGKSPFIKVAGSTRIGIPIPEYKCSKCGRSFYDDGTSASNNRHQGKGSSD